MRKFFKSLAVLLALTLIVGVIPAAAADDISLQAEKILYIGGSKGQKADDTKCKVGEKKLVANMLKGGFDKTTMKVDLKSADKSIVKTTKAGRIVAKSIGTTTVTVTVFDADGNQKFQKDLKVIVKKNATSLTVNGIEDGKEYDVEDVLTVALPIYENGVKVDTDKRALTCDSPKVNITDNGNRTFTVKFTERGEYTIVAKSYQSKSYPGATQEKSFTVKVKAPAYEVKQTVYNAFEMTFPTETAAKEAETETSKTITDGLQHVTQDKNVVQVYQIGTAGEKINTYIQSAKATKNVLKITMFTDLLEDTEYSVEYKEYDPAVFKAVKWIPAELTNDYSYIPSNEQEGGTATLNYYVKTVEGVDITNKVKGDSGIVYEDSDKNNTYDKYAVLDNRVDFYKNNVQADVIAKYTYWRDGKETPLDNRFTVYAKDTRRYAIDYYLLGNPNSAFDIDKKREATISVDEGVKTLNVRIAVDLNGDGVYGDDVTGDGKVDGADFIYTTDSNVTFVTSNADKLNVEKESGITYAPKDANEVVNVYVYYKDVLVDADIDSANGKNPIPVTVYGKKTLKDLKVTLKTDGKYSYSEDEIKKYDENGNIIKREAAKWYTANVTYPIDEDSEKFEIEAVDQFGATYGNVDIYIQKTTDALDAINSGAVYMNGTQIKKATDVNNISAADLLVNNVGKITPTFTAKSYDNGVKNISFRVTAVDQITKTKVQRNFSFTVKNTTESTVSRLVVDKVNGGTTSFRVLGKDSAGYAVCGYWLDSEANVKAGAANSRVYLSFANNRSSKDLTNAQTNSNDGSLKKAITINYTESIVGGGLTKLSNDVEIFSTATATGSALSSAKLTNVVRYVQSASGQAISFLPTSSYAVKAWQLNRSGKLAIVDSLSFEYAPNVHKVDFEWKASHSENTEVYNVLNEAFRFSVYEYVDTNNDGQKDTWKVVNYNQKTAKELETAGLEFAISYVKKDNMISFLSFYEKDITGRVISETPINRTVYIGVSK